MTEGTILGHVSSSTGDKDRYDMQVLEITFLSTKSKTIREVVRRVYASAVPVQNGDIVFRQNSNHNIAILRPQDDFLLQWLFWRRHITSMQYCRIMLNSWCVLAPRKQQVALRDSFVCPLCEQIPEKIRPQVESGVANPQDGYEFLSDHIANHIKSLSLLSLPCLDGIPTAANAEGGSVALHDSFQNVLKEGSVAQPPSGADFLDGASILPDLWSSMEQKELTTLLASNATSSLDRDFSDYVPSGRPPDMLNFEWLEALKKWKGDEDIGMEEETHSDPILALLHKARLKSSENLSNHSGSDSPNPPKLATLHKDGGVLAHLGGRHNADSYVTSKYTCASNTPPVGEKTNKDFEMVLK